LRRHPLLALLNILSVAVGVGVYLATQIANHSANRAFAATVEIVLGKTDLEITATGPGALRRRLEPAETYLAPLQTSSIDSSRTVVSSNM
jgi:hypothetical protein